MRQIFFFFLHLSTNNKSTSSVWFTQSSVAKNQFSFQYIHAIPSFLLFATVLPTLFVLFRFRNYIRQTAVRQLIIRFSSTPIVHRSWYIFFLCVIEKKNGIFTSFDIMLCCIGLYQRKDKTYRINNDNPSSVKVKR